MAAMKQGKIIAAPRASKNEKGERDPEMHQTKKGNQWYHRFAGLRLRDEGETAKAHIHAKTENPFRVIKRQFGFQMTRLRGMLKNRCKVNVAAAPLNLFMSRHARHDLGSGVPIRGTPLQTGKINHLKRRNQAHQGPTPL